MELTGDASDLVSWLGRDDLVSEGVLDIADLVDADFPLGIVSVVDADDRV